MTGVIGVFIVLLVWRFVVLWAATVYEAIGLSPVAARFEARSALTGAGYTTSQSEPVARHAAGRRVASTLMVVGYVGPATVLALLDVSFVLPPDGEGLEAEAIVLAVLSLVVLGLDRLGLIRLMGSRPARALARRMTASNGFETWTLVGDRALATLFVPDDAGRAEHLLDALTTPDITVLAVTAAGHDGTVYTIDAQPGGSGPGPGDEVVVFGPGPALERLRPLAG